jgi:opacity protein-like surface antigen
MKKLLVLTAVLLLSVAPAMAGNYVKGTVGYFSPTDGDLDGSFGLNVAGGMDLKDQLDAPVSVELGIGYTAPEATGVDVSIVPITLTGLYELPLDVPDFAFNVGAGLGLYMWDAEVDGTSVADGNDFGFHIQAGADYKLNDQLALVGELKWAKVDFDDADGGGTSVNVGAKYNF